MGRFEGTISLEYSLVTLAVLSYYQLEECLASQIHTYFECPLVIDIGVGTGITTNVILEKNPGCRIRGVDNEISMMEQANCSLAPYLKNKSVELYYSDAFDFLSELDSDSVDVVASAFTLHNCTRDERSQMEVEFFRVLRPGGMFINLDKYAADNRQEYIRELVDQIVRYDVLREHGREDLRRIWIKHEIEDQEPERIMWTCQSIEQLEGIGFYPVSLMERIAQYAIVTAFKPQECK